MYTIVGWTSCQDQVYENNIENPLSHRVSYFLSLQQYISTSSLSCSPGVLLEILKDISVSSHLATMLKAQDFRLVVGAMQMAEVLLQKLPEIFNVYFHREGVMHQLQNLKDVPLLTLATPKQETPSTSTAAPPPPIAVPVATNEPSAPVSTKK